MRSLSFSNRPSVSMCFFRVVISKIMGVSAAMACDWCRGISKPLSLWTNDEKEDWIKHRKKFERTIAYRENIRKKLTGRKHTEAAKEKMRGRKHTKEAIEKMRIKQILNSSSWKGDKASKSAGYVRARKLYPAPEGYEHHHLDGNPLNNSKENVLILT